MACPGLLWFALACPGLLVGSGPIGAALRWFTLSLWPAPVWPGLIWPVAALHEVLCALFPRECLGQKPKTPAAMLPQRRIITPATKLTQRAREGAEREDRQSFFLRGVFERHVRGGEACRIVAGGAATARLVFYSLQSATDQQGNHLLMYCAHCLTMGLPRALESSVWRSHRRHCLAHSMGVTEALPKFLSLTHERDHA